MANQEPRVPVIVGTGVLTLGEYRTVADRQTLDAWTADMLRQSPNALNNREQLRAEIEFVFGAELEVPPAIRFRAVGVSRLRPVPAKRSEEAEVHGVPEERDER